MAGLLIQEASSDENWELGIEHWSDQENLTNAQFSIPNFHPRRPALPLDMSGNE